MLTADRHPPSSSPGGSSLQERILRRFSRVTTSGAFISEIDGLRFIAIGTVVLFHLMVGLLIKNPTAFTPPAGTPLVGIARVGFHGVELFFIISGFILALPFASHHLMQRHAVRLGQYFLRRVTRLEPPYMLCMILMFVALVVVKHRSTTELFPHLAASLLYVHNIVFADESLINNVAWSLEIEIQFYILVPLLSWLFAIRKTGRRRGILIGMCLLSVVFGWLFIGPEGAMRLSILRFLHFFLIGFLLADLYLVDWNEQPKRHWRWDVVSAVGWPALFIVWNYADEWLKGPAGRTSLLTALFFPAIVLFLYVAVFRGPITNRVMTNPWLTSIGGMCYTIYLFHNPLIGTVLWLTHGIALSGSYTVDYLVQAALVIPPLLGASGVYFLLIEKPCMRKDWPKRLLERVRSFSRRSSSPSGTDPDG
jgi:peptidoglycan/LPS O-acetylase OafA/YrhL